MLRAVSAAALLASLACASSPPVAVDTLGHPSLAEAATFALLPTRDAGGDSAYGPTARREDHVAGPGHGRSMLPAEDDAS